MGHARSSLRLPLDVKRLSLNEFGRAAPPDRRGPVCLTAASMISSGQHGRRPHRHGHGRPSARVRGPRSSKSSTPPSIQVNLIGTFNCNPSRRRASWATNTPEPGGRAGGLNQLYGSVSFCVRFDGQIARPPTRLRMCRQSSAWTPPVRAPIIPPRGAHWKILVGHGSPPLYLRHFRLALRPAP